MPSLRQLNEAVMAFIAENPDDKITVVVDATFGHRIDPSEVAEFNAAIENNELVSPPAGAVGRGDAFVLAIAHKVGAVILSNDSYQEFHGDQPWVFDEGRLLGGKPVPHVGWVFVARTPVRGPISRRAVKGRKSGREPKAPRPTAAASQPMPVPKSPPPRSAKATKGAVASEAAAAASAAPQPARPVARVEPASPPTQPRGAFVNESVPFLTFVGAHPVGSAVSGVVESYSSHGAYVMVDDTRCYVPLRYMADPAPRAARDVVKLGQDYPLVVVSFNAGRRSVDLAVPGHEPPGVVAAAAGKPRPRRGAKAVEPAIDDAVVATRPSRRGRKVATAPAPVLEPVVAPAAPPARGRKKAAEPPVVTVEAPAKKGRGKALAKAPAAPMPAAPTPAAPVLAEPAPAAPKRRAKTLAPAAVVEAPTAPRAAPGRRAKRSATPVEPVVHVPATASTPAARSRRRQPAPPEPAPAVVAAAPEPPIEPVKATPRRRRPASDAPAAPTPRRAPAAESARASAKAGRPRASRSRPATPSGD